MPFVRLAPFIKMVSAMLTSKQINPRSKYPPRRPSFGTSLQGPNLRNFASANDADMNEDTKVIKNCVESSPMIILGFCPARQSKMCV